MQEKKEALRLIEETLKELESSKGSVLIAIQKLSRVALILDNQDVYIWCQIQLGETIYTQPLEKLINIQEKYQKEQSDELVEAFRSQIIVLSKLKLKKEFHYTNEEFNIKFNKSGGGYKNIGVIEDIYTSLIKNKDGNDGVHYTKLRNSQKHYNLTCF